MTSLLHPEEVPSQANQSINYILSVNETRSFHVHVEVLLGPSSLQVVNLILLVAETGLLFSLFLLFSFEVELQVVLGDVVKNIALGLVLFIFQHASHAV